MCCHCRTGQTQQNLPKRGHQHTEPSQLHIPTDMPSGAQAQVSLVATPVFRKATCPQAVKPWRPRVGGRRTSVCVVHTHFSGTRLKVLAKVDSSPARELKTSLTTWWCTPLIPGGQEQAYFCELEVYVADSRPAEVKQDQPG